MHSSVKKGGLILELILAFCVPLFLWIIGLVFSVGIVLDFVALSHPVLAKIVGATVFGGMGLWGMVNLAIKVLFPTFSVIRPMKMWLYITFGFVAFALGIAASGLSQLGTILYIVAPSVAVAGHFIYLARDYLVGGICN
jgi:hypothetical protein